MRSRVATRSLVVHAPAKLNLFLEVLGKRPDGFHDIETLMVSVGLYDTLTFREEVTGDVRLVDSVVGRSRQPPGTIPAGADNLIVRAANLLRDRARVDDGVSIELVKRIPAAAGLGGGSSDAAATLVGLNRLWGLDVPNDELSALAAELGSDVPFFLGKSGAAVCRGRGERVEPLALPRCLHFVVARPHSGLSTADVYRACRPSPHPVPLEPLLDALQRGRTDLAARRLHNRLHDPALTLNTDLQDVRKRFEQLPFVGHSMSGSGTAYYGICQTERQARRVAARLRATRTGRVFVVRSRL